MSDHEQEQTDSFELSAAEREIIAQNFGLDPYHPGVDVIGSLQYENGLLLEVNQQAREQLDNAEDEIRALQAENDELRTDELTGLTVYRAAMRDARKLLTEIDANIQNPELSDPHAPNAALVIFGDIEAMHFINKIRGHQAGDEAIKYGSDKAIDAADFLRAILRTHDRRASSGRNHEERRTHDRRAVMRQDIITRKGGDEFFAILPFRETPEFTREMMAQLIKERLDSRDESGRAKVPYMHWGMAFYEPGMTPEDLQREADPKGKSRSKRFGRAIIKYARLAARKY